MNQQETHIMQMNPFYFRADLAVYHPRDNEIMANDAHELMHFKSVVATFYNYTHDMEYELTRLKNNITSLSEHHKSLLKSNYIDRYAKLKQAIIRNAEFCFLIVGGYVDLFPEVDLSKVNYLSQLPYFPNSNPRDLGKLRVTLKQFVRDWSKEGKPERDQCYQPILDALLQYFPDAKTHKPKYKLLLPGCGLGRLVFECSVAGFSAQGNEFSYFMLLASHFIINLCQNKESFTIQPFANMFNNRMKEDDALQEIRIPDVLPSSQISEDDEFSIVSGEFIQVFANSTYDKYWDSVVTCFFIDTANNIIEYIEAIYAMLKPGGVWINLGPLEYHYSNQYQELSIELSWEDIEHIIKQVGFELQKVELKQTTYNQSYLDMKSLVYQSIFFCAVKN